VVLGGASARFRSTGGLRGARAVRIKAHGPTRCVGYDGVVFSPGPRSAFLFPRGCRPWLGARPRAAWGLRKFSPPSPPAMPLALHRGVPGGPQQQYTKRDATVVATCVRPLEGAVAIHPTCASRCVRATGGVRH
jgi:hypothetical protein